MSRVREGNTEEERALDVMIMTVSVVGTETFNVFQVL